MWGTGRQGLGRLGRARERGIRERLIYDHQWWDQGQSQIQQGRAGICVEDMKCVGGSKVDIITKHSLWLRWQFMWMVKLVRMWPLLTTVATVTAPMRLL